MKERYKRPETVVRNAVLITADEWSVIRTMFRESRYLNRELNDFVLDLYTRHDLEKYYGFKMDMRRYLIDSLNDM